MKSSQYYLISAMFVGIAVGALAHNWKQAAVAIVAFIAMNMFEALGNRAWTKENPDA